MPGIDLVGERFDKLLVTEYIESTPSGKRWMCVCDCGQKIVKMTTQLRRKGRLSGGCRHCEPLVRSKATSLRTHGLCELGKTRLYNVWKSMRRRCSGKNDPSYKYYGAKGVSVCAEWDSYPEFKKWAEETGYQDKIIDGGKNKLTTIDRIDSESGYSPSNCRWLSASENSIRAHKGIKHE